MRNAYLEIIENCNLKCSFCSRGDRKGVYDKKVLKNIIKMYYDKGFKKLIFTGGEPLLHPDLDELISFAKPFGFELAIQTNGILLTRGMSKRLKKAGLDQILMSIHSHLSFVEDKMMSGKNV